LRLRGMRAIVCQHELDHLDGVLFYDRINPTNPLDTYGEPI
jgi:peptide deformylase